MRRRIAIDLAGQYPDNAAGALNLPPGEAGVDCTIAAMLALVHDTRDKPSAALKAAAAEIDAVASPPNRWPYIAPATALYRWMRKRFRFVKDPEGVELLRHPDQMLQAMRDGGGYTDGDCDELATLAAALAIQLGLRPAFIVMDGIPSAGRFHHVFYGIIGPDGRTVTPYNPQEGTPPGQWPPASRRKIYPVV